jgi:hypothetical protein
MHTKLILEHLLGRHLLKHKWETTIKRDLKVASEVVNWIEFSGSRIKLLDLMLTVMNLQIL